MSRPSHHVLAHVAPTVKRSNGCIVLPLRLAAGCIVDFEMPSAVASGIHASLGALLHPEPKRRSRATTSPAPVMKPGGRIL